MYCSGPGSKTVEDERIARTQNIKKDHMDCLQAEVVFFYILCESTNTEGMRSIFEVSVRAMYVILIPPNSGEFSIVQNGEHIYNIHISVDCIPLCFVLTYRQIIQQQ